MGNVTGVPPCKLVLLGSGHVVEQVARAAWHAGIQMQVFDKDIYKLQRLKHTLGFPLVTQVIDSENLPQALQDATVIVGALRSDSGVTPCVVTEEMVSKLKPGTLIIDVCIDQGGCFETSEITNLGKPVFKKFGVSHYCVPNIPSLVSQTASIAMSNLLTSFVLKAGKTGFGKAQEPRHGSGLLWKGRKLPQQSQHTLRQLVGLGNHGGTGLLQNLGTAQCRGFRCEVCVHDPATGCRLVFNRCLQE